MLTSKQPPECCWFENQQKHGFSAGEKVPYVPIFNASTLMIIIHLSRKNDSSLSPTLVSFTVSVRATELVYDYTIILMRTVNMPPSYIWGGRFHGSLRATNTAGNTVTPPWPAEDHCVPTTGQDDFLQVLLSLAHDIMTLWVEHH